MFEETKIFDNDEGSESAPTVAAPEDDPFGAQADSADETAQAAPTGQLTEGAEEERGAKVSQTDTAGGADGEKAGEESEKSLEDVIAEVDEQIADKKNPPHYRDALKVYKKAFLRETAKSEELYEPLKEYGELPAILDDLEILKGLESFDEDPVTFLPTATVRPFVEKFVEKKGMEKVLEVMNEFGKLPSPNNRGENLFQEVIRSAGLDPSRLEELRAFAETGYQRGEGNAPDPSELELIPAELREAFASLAPDIRDDFLLMEDAARDFALEGIQARLDRDRDRRTSALKQEQNEIEEQRRAEQKFYESVHARTAELLDASGEKLFTDFTETLVNTGIDELEAVAIANLMSMTLSSTGAESRANRAALEKIGVTLDEGLSNAFHEWLGAAQAVAAHEKRGDEKNARAAQAKFEELGARLQRKANPVIAAIAKYRGERGRSAAEIKSERLANLTRNTGINANEGVPNTIGRAARANSSTDWENVNPFAS